MDFFVYSRDAPGSAPLRDDDELLERHWSYMDAFAAAMIARGPTLAPDRETPTGSLHVLALPDTAAAAEFVEREPNNRAGVYAEHRIWAFENLLGRTMWEFRRPADEPRFLVVASAGRNRSALAPARPAPLAAVRPELRERLILYGALAETDAGRTVGVAFALQVAGRDAVEPTLRAGAVAVEAFPDVEIHDWELGGRR
jgi:uncharacterized protein YciI